LTQLHPQAAAVAALGVLHHPKRPEVLAALVAVAQDTTPVVVEHQTKVMQVAAVVVVLLPQAVAVPVVLGRPFPQTLAQTAVLVLHHQYLERPLVVLVAVLVEVTQHLRLVPLQVAVAAVDLTHK
jgi:hypothetical protein